MSIRTRTERLAVLRRHEPGLDRKRSNAREHVAAVRRRVDPALADDDLDEEIVHVGLARRRAANDRDLARERMRATRPVDLPCVGTHCGDQHAVAQLLVRRQRVALEIQAFGASAAHQKTGNSRLHGRMLRKSAPRNNGSRRGRALATMRRALGTTGIEVHAIGLGAMPLSIQGRPDERVGLEVIAAFLDGGGNFIDTAISYCLDNRDLGHNERLIAKALLELDRPDVVVATKGGLTRPNGRWDVDGDPKWLRRCCEQSVAERRRRADSALLSARGRPPRAVCRLARHAREAARRGQDRAHRLVERESEAARRRPALHEDRRRAESLQRLRAPRLRQRAHRPLPPRAHRLRRLLAGRRPHGAPPRCRETPRCCASRASTARLPTWSRCAGCSTRATTSCRSRARARSRAHAAASRPRA